jgi:TonB family protein
LLALMMANRIANPLRRAVALAEQVADGDLTQTLHIDQKDEVGDLANALNRMTGQLEDLIGNASCAFTIMADGSFADLRLVRGSGVTRLDQTALLAVHAASGVVKRPKITGSAPLHISVTVKYQHSL